MNEQLEEDRCAAEAGKQTDRNKSICLCNQGSETKDGRQKQSSLRPDRRAGSNMLQPFHSADLRFSAVRRDTRSLCPDEFLCPGALKLVLIQTETLHSGQRELT